MGEFSSDDWSPSNELGDKDAFVRQLSELTEALRENTRAKVNPVIPPQSRWRDYVLGGLVVAVIALGLWLSATKSVLAHHLQDVVNSKKR